MSNRTSDFDDESYEGRSYEEEPASRGGRHLKKDAAPSHSSRHSEPEAEDEFIADPSSEEETPRRERRVREEEAPRRERRAREEEAPRREHRPRGDDPRREPVRRSTGASPKRRRKKRKKNRRGLKILLIVVAVLALLALAGYLVFMHFYGMLNVVGRGSSATPAPTAVVQTATERPEVTPEPTPEPTPTPEPLTEEELRELEEMELKASLQEEAEEVMFNENVYNLLLIGTDGRGSVMERSDSMILLSVNKETKEIWITSFMRDTQVTVPNYGLAHLNWATSIGGIDTLIATIESEKNFAINIDNWASVNFLDFVNVANLLGPVTVSVEAKEVDDINKTITEVCQLIDKDAGRSPDDVENNYPRCYFPWMKSGTYTITDGAQILGYCRERHFGGDTGRSAKQREVVMQMMENVKQMTLAEQYELAKAVLPLITTDVTAGQSFSLLLQLPSIKEYTIHTQQCPVIGSFWKGRDHNNLSIYNADFAVNRNFLRATIYGQRFSAAELTSKWTGEATLVYWNDAWN
ncbi:MAG: LCP family protein [Oscillospiraceae bacterium]|nr:LCP family protein [Oscillospiraceae bacterium]